MGEITESAAYVNIKKLNQARHARQRAAQRFSLTVNHAEMRRVVKDIQQGRATFVDRQSLRVTRWVVQVGGKGDAVKVGSGDAVRASSGDAVTAVAVYDSKRKSIATFLTLEMVERDMRKQGITWAVGPEGTDNTLCS